MLAACNLFGPPTLGRTFDFRASLESGVPWSTADQVAKSTIFAVPAYGNQIALSDAAGTTTGLYASGQLSLGLSGLVTGKNYDVNAYLSPNGGSFGPRNVGLAIYTASTSTVYTAALPANVAGDLLILAVIVDNGGTAIPTPAGWTARLSATVAGPPTSSLFTKVSAGETYVNITTITGKPLCYAAHVFMNAAYDTGAAGGGAPGASSVVAPSLTPSAAGNYLLGYFLAALGPVWAGPAGPTKVQDSGVLGEYELLASAAATGTRTATSSLATYLVSYAVSLKINVATPPGPVFELSAPWATDTARTDAISFVNGMWLKTSDYTRRPFATFRASSPTTTEDSEAQFWLHNWVNPVRKTSRTYGPASSVSSAVAVYTTISSSFATTILNGSPWPFKATANLNLILQNANTTPSGTDASLAVQVGSIDYPVAGWGNDTSALVQISGTRDVPIPVGATAVNARWSVVGGTQSMTVPASTRGVAGRPESCNLQVSYMG